MLLRDVPKKSVLLANPMDAASKFLGGALAPTTPTVNLGAEHIGMRRSVCELSSVLQEASMTEQQWTKFLKALVYIMTEETIDNMWEYAKTAPARKKVWNAAKNAKSEQQTAEQTAKVKAATSSWHSA
eukprot:9725862-Karenia_brevis.AAC.3